MSLHGSVWDFNYSMKWAALIQEVLPKQKQEGIFNFFNSNAIATPQGIAQQMMI